MLDPYILHAWCRNLKFGLLLYCSLSANLPHKPCAFEALAFILAAIFQFLVDICRHLSCGYFFAVEEHLQQFIGFSHYFRCRMSLITTLAKTNMAMKITIFSTIYIFQRLVFHCHVSFQEGHSTIFEASGGLFDSIWCWCGCGRFWWEDLTVHGLPAARFALHFLESPIFQSFLDWEDDWFLWSGNLCLFP